MDFSKFDLVSKLLNTAREHIEEQYDNENIRLNGIIIELTALVREKEEKNKELEKRIEENTFNEENYNKVSLLRILSKENDELKKQNQKLMTSLSYRNYDVELENLKDNSETVNETEEIDSTLEKMENQEENNSIVEIIEETILQKEIITYKDKQYIQEDNIVYRIKKNGEKGKKAGTINNGKIKFIKKKKSSN
jgi:hypothetical protein